MKRRTPRTLDVTRAGLLGLAASSLMLLPTGPAAVAQGEPSDCAAVTEWVDYLYAVTDRQRAFVQREVDLTRDPSLSTDELAERLAAVAAEREDANAEFQAHAVPSSALPVQTAYSLAWELDASVAQAYLRAIRAGDERQRGIADGFNEAGGTIASRANTLLSNLLTACGR